MWLLRPKGLLVWCRGMETLKLMMNEAAPEEKPGCLSPAQCHPIVATLLLCPKLVLHHAACNGDTEVSQRPQGWDGALHGRAAPGGRAMPIACALEDTVVP